ncbi:unnamed protein product [Rotaria sp. Silwood2]|nr:unnamed protein product [Rotaria sp. Silwood2]CAF4032529.1 unnamed protein product [Rotaria sp. Silwood2]
MLLGCALAGPLGNGKTELIRDLAKAMGLLCIVTSCGEAKKMVTLYRYASEVLSKQGLRSFKSVSSMTGYLKRTSMKEDPEEIVLLRAFRHMNIPKFIYDDVNLFLTLLNDLFPNIHCPETSYKNFNLIIKEILIKPQYILVSEQLIQQGKTVVLNTLAEAQTRMGMKTNWYTLNPKALSVIESYGTLDPLTRIYPVLFKDVDECIDPIILDILSKNIQGDLTHQYVKLGDKYIDIDKNVRMYFTCRLSNPILSTLHFSYSKVINYTVILKGLKEQLLSSLVKIERHNIKILDHTELIETLENTKVKVNEVIQALNLGEKIRQDIEKLFDTYRLVARRGAVLYFFFFSSNVNY